DKRSLPRERVHDVKRLAADAFLLARQRSAAARDFGALLIDEQYASDVIARSIKGKLNVGTPAEKAGAIPLAWATDPFSTALTGAFVKVLARYRTDDEPAAWRSSGPSSAPCRHGVAAPASRSCSKCSSRGSKSLKTSSKRRAVPRC